MIITMPTYLHSPSTRIIWLFLQGAFSHTPIPANVQILRYSIRHDILNIVTNPLILSNMFDKPVDVMNILAHTHFKDIKKTLTNIFCQIYAPELSRAITNHSPVLQGPCEVGAWQDLIEILSYLVSYVLMKRNRYESNLILCYIKLYIFAGSL